MTKRTATQIAVEMSEKRSALNQAMTPAEGESAEDHAKRRDGLVNDLAALEPEYRAALAIEATETAAQSGTERDTETREARERRELRSKCRVTSYILATNKGRLNGPEEELRAELGYEVGDIPLELWETRTEDRAITEAPGTVGVNVQRIYPAIFAPSIAPYFGINMPQVPSGTYAVPSINASLTAGSRAKDADQAATAATFTVATSTPKQVSARLEFNISDVAAAGTNLEAALRQNLQMALSAELDDQVINGAGASDDLEGLFHKLANPSADSTTLTFNHGLSKLADLIDGLHATETSHIRQMVGVDTYKLAARSVSVPASGGEGELTLADYLRANSGGFRTNSRMPAVASTKQQGLAYRSGIAAAGAIVPHWGRVSIDDPYTNSAKGQRNVTIHVLLGDLIIPHAGVYAQTEYKVS